MSWFTRLFGWNDDIVDRSHERLKEAREDFDRAKDDFHKTVQELRQPDVLAALVRGLRSDRRGRVDEPHAES